MSNKMLFIYLSTSLLLSSCYKEKYIHNYGPQVPQGAIPYYFGQMIKFENGSNDTITFQCAKFQNIEEESQGSCSNEEKHCTEIFHTYGLLVDLETLDRSRTFNLVTYGKSVSVHYWTDPNADPGVGRFRFYLSPNTRWSDSIQLNGKTFYNYQTNSGIRIMAAEPGTPLYTDSVIYSKNDGIIMFSLEKKVGNVIVNYERWVLVK